MFYSIKPIVSSLRERPIHHLGWYTNNLDDLFQKMSSKGINFPIKPREFGPVRLAFAEDPCGIWIELLEPPNGIIRKPT
jgi:hypothetical protein